MEKSAELSLREQVYYTIKQRIINCSYLPGSFLTEKEIVEELGVSRTPFREAANMLSREDLVQIIPYKGIFVTEIALKDVTDLYCIRERLEPLVVELAIEHLPQREAELFYAAAKAQALEDCSDQRKAMQEDEALHVMLLRHTNNRTCIRIMEEIYDQNHRMRALSMDQRGTVEITRQEHLNILEYLIKRDKEGAIRAMREHIVSSRERSLRAILKQNGTVIKL